MITKVSPFAHSVESVIKNYTSRIRAGEALLIDVRNIAELFDRLFPDYFANNSLGYTQNTRKHMFENMLFVTYLMRLQVQLNSRIEKPVFGCSIYFHINDLENIDHLVDKNGCENTDDFYRRVVQCYMQCMGYGEQPYVVIKCNDKKRMHLQVISIRVDAGGHTIDYQFVYVKSEQAKKKVINTFGLYGAENEAT